MRGEPFQPHIVIVVEAALVIVNENRGRYVHGIDKHQAVLYTAFFQTGFYLLGDVDECPSLGDIQP
jgi:hypothetical protein